MNTLFASSEFWGFWQLFFDAFYDVLQLHLGMSKKFLGFFLRQTLCKSC